MSATTRGIGETDDLHLETVCHPACVAMYWAWREPCFCGAKEASKEREAARKQRETQTKAREGEEKA